MMGIRLWGGVGSSLFRSPKGEPVILHVRGTVSGQDNVCLPVVQDRIACGTGRVDRARLAAVSGAGRLRVADALDVIRVTGFPAGGVAPLALPHQLPVIVDSAVMELPVAWGGAGREELLLRVDPTDIVRLNDATVAEIVSPA